ncbi:MAG TPA: family 1 glycosylhydrolase [Candidatus Acidoferrum sp.]|nr:family 1 glycosylhydrolase [Candidatus Acidoferrum sp.]
MREFEVWASPEPTVARVDAHRVRDQLALTGHDRRDGDVALLASLGVDASRTPILWERCAPDDPTRIDLSWAERRLGLLRDAAIEPIVTLLHHGSGPRYTDLLDPAFPVLFADYAESVARMFPWVRRWTPINEPLTTARFSTLYGVWYPNLRDDHAFGRALVHQTLAILTALERIRSVNPAAELVLTEDLQRFVAADEGVARYAAFLRERMYLSAELLAGRIDERHALAPFLLTECGVHARELAEIRARAAAPALIAFNHYPHSERYLFTTPDGTIGDVPAVYVRGEAPPRAQPLLAEAAARLRLPLALGEVHVHAPADERVRWLAQHVDDVRALREASVDVRGVGVWAAFGMTDWHSLLREEAAVAEDGIFTFAGAGGTPERTALADAVLTLTRTGKIVPEATPGWWEREDRYLGLDELLAMRDRGLPEGDHVVRARTISR